jgi:putative flavoprotein involved in K+ transport
MSRGNPLVRSKPADLEAAGVERLPRIDGIVDGLPVTSDGRRLDVDNIIWATGFRAGFEWIDLDVVGDQPRQTFGVADAYRGLYFVGLDFITAPSSGQIHGVGRDAARIAGAVADRSRTAPEPAPV